MLNGKLGDLLRGIVPVKAATILAISGEADKLGWLDDAPLTDAHKRRIAEISGSGRGNNLEVIRSHQSGARGNITRLDFELLRQDRRRARAAYPEVSEDDLYRGTWLSVDVSARVPSDFCTSGNSDGTVVNGRSYLDGGCYVSAVDPKYSDRADAPTTKRVLAELREAKTSKAAALIAKWGYMSAWSGTDGSASIHAYPDPLPSNTEPSDVEIAGRAVVVIDGTTRYEFPFVANDWVKASWTKEKLAQLAERREAVVTDYTPPPAKPRVRKDGLLARGQICPQGRLCWSKWNGDGYDNNDIGPSNPASWILEQPFGIAYLPAPDNGERLSDPDKPWYLVITYYGFPPQISGGWTEPEAKAALPQFQTGHAWGMMGQDPEELNRGNLKEARATQIPPDFGIKLADRGLPVQPAKTPDPNHVPYSPGMTLFPGQSTSIGAGWSK